MSPKFNSYLSRRSLTDSLKMQCVGSGGLKILPISEFLWGTKYLGPWSNFYDLFSSFFMTEYSLSISSERVNLD